MEIFLIELVAQYPMTAGVLSVLYVISSINKPLFALIRAYVESTKATGDNELLAKVEASRAYRALAYGLDWIARIKLPVKK